MDALRPGRLGRYDIVETLSHGPRSRTYKGVDPISQRSVALKTIARHLLDEGRVARLRQEIATASRLDHRGIVKVFEYGEDSEWAYVATEFVEGWPLKERRQIPIGDAVAVMMQLLEALDYAHARGVVHRHLRPSNLLLTSKGLKVDGFGVASLDPGTPYYLSPEQLREFPADDRSDVFSAGIVFYELMTGVSQFAGPPESLPERVCNAKERPVSEVNPNLRRVWDPVFAKALAKGAHDRYLSARSFCDAIRDAFADVHGSQPNQAVSHETIIMATSLGDPNGESTVSSHPGSPEGEAGATWDEATLHTVEKQLAAYIGPLAKILVRKASKKTTDLDRLYSILSNNLQEDAERRAFLAGKTEIHGGAQSNPAEAVHARSEAAASPAPGERGEAPAPKPPVYARPKSGSVPAAIPLPKTETRPPTPAADAHPSSGGAPAATSPKVDTTPPVPAAGARPSSSAVPAAKPAPTMETKPEVRSGDKPPAANPVPKRPSGSVAAAPSKPAFPYEDLLGKQPENLAGYLKDDPAQHDDVINAFVATVDAVARLHAAKARVEPLTPQSICFDKMGKVTIVNSQATGSATTSVVVGNPRYAVPEIFSEKAAGGESNIPAAHVYALGFIFYEIMLGRQLFEKTFAQQRSEIEWLRWHADLESKAPAVKSLLPGCPDTLSELLASMIEKHTEKRAADLQAITASLRDIARRSNKTVVMMRKPPANEPMRKLITPAKPAPKPKKKSSATLFIVLLFILVLAAAAFYMWQNPELYQGLLSHFSHRAPAP